MDGRALSHHTPTLYDDIKIFGEVSFSHKIMQPADGTSVGDFLDTVVTGRVDHGIGRAIPYSRSDPPTRSHPKRLFQSLLLVNLNHAMPQLVVYLASIHQSRLKNERQDASVYGAASDGKSFVFVTITHEGVFKKSRQFEIDSGELGTILGCLKYMLGMPATMSPNATPEVGEEEAEVHPDLPMAIDV